MSTKVQFIINPASGSSKSAGIIAQVRARLRRLDLRPETYTTTGPDDARRFAATLDSHTRTVVVVGGDGTVSEVAGGLIHHPLPIWVIPTGTENILAKEIGFRPDPDDLGQALSANRVMTCDLGMLNDRPFLIIAGFGFDAEVVQRLVATRRGHISYLNYFWPIWRTFWEHHFPVVRVIADGQEVCHEPSLVFVGNLSRYAIGLKILKRAHCSDGLLDLCVYPCRHQFELLLHAARTTAGLHLDSGRVIYRRCRTIRLESSTPVASQVDGDPAGHLPATIRVLPGRVRLLLPSNPAKSFSSGRAA